MKDECAGEPIREYIGLRPKMYSIVKESGVNERKLKGVKRYVVQKHITHEQYRQVLDDRQTMKHGMNMLRSEGHIMYGIHMDKISLSPLDTKRWIADDGVNTLAYGHYATR